MAENWVTVSEAAQIYNVKERTIYRWVKKGELQSQKHGKYTYVLVDTGFSETFYSGDVSDKVSQLESELKSKDKYIERLEHDNERLWDVNDRLLNQNQELTRHNQRLIAARSEETDESDKPKKKKWWQIG